MDITEAFRNSVLKASGNARPIYLAIGGTERTGAILGQAVPMGEGATVYEIDDGAATAATLPEGVVRRHLPGRLVAAADYPRLAAVVAFAQTRTDARSIVAAYTAARGSAAADPNGTSPLSTLASLVEREALDLVVIDDDLLAGQIVEQLWGAKSFLLFDTRRSFGGAAAFAALYVADDYQLSANDEADPLEWALFTRRPASLPINFFTIVLNGDPFIRYHHSVLSSLPFDWHWHIVEGVAELVNDTAWSVATGGHIAEDLHDNGLSNDGTSRYLDELSTVDPDRVTVYRKGDGRFWKGKLEMVNAPLRSIADECLLWQVDSDELWTADQIIAVRDAFLADAGRTAASFWCNYYVGPDRGIATRYNYAQNPRQEWLRVWRFTPGMTWDKHEPPVLQGVDANGDYDVGRRHPFTHAEMEARGAVFDHFAYATEAQARFKERYYGYKDAVGQWHALQAAPRRSAHLRDYLAWVNDETMFDTVDRLGWLPLASPDPETGEWRFHDAGERAALRTTRPGHAQPIIVVDGVFFQLSNSGIARLWVNLLREWCRSGFGERVILLDRGGTAPRIDGVRYHSIEPHSWATIDGDARYLQEVCDRLGADLFLSTYYTTPIRTPTVFSGYDMIPEALGFDLDDVWWRQKRRAIQYAAGFMMISQSSARELARFFPFAATDETLVAYASVDPIFTPCTPDEVAIFRDRHGLDRDYVMLVGDRVGWKGYKNGVVVFAALASMPAHQRPLLVCVGGASELEDSGKLLLGDADVRLLRLDDANLRLCYGGALAYICPSLMEGFGLPIVEAMAVGTPALVCRNSSIPEVAADAGVYFDADDPASLVRAIESMRDGDARRARVAAGREQAAAFDQAETARAIAAFCTRVASRDEPAIGDRDGDLLADAFKEAETSRDAIARTAEAEQRIFAAKIELATAARTLRLAFDEKDDLQAPDRTAQAQNAVTQAYASLRDGKQARSASDSSAIIPTSRDIGVSVSEATGLSRTEGPYPAFEMFKPFRWQVEPVSRTSYQITDAIDLWLEVEFGNVEDNQRVTLLVDERPVCLFRPDQLGWSHIWRIRIPISLSAGAASVSIAAAAFGCSSSDGRNLHIAIYTLRLKERAARPGDRPEVADLSLAGAADRKEDAPVLEVPAMASDAVGLAPREGPYPDFGIHRAFRWQIRDVSEHRFEIDEDRDAWLHVTFSNVQPDQHVELWQDDMLLQAFAPPTLGWAHRWQIRVPVHLSSGATTFRVKASAYHDEEQGGRSLYIGLYDVRLLFRTPGPEQIADVVDIGQRR